MLHNAKQEILTQMTNFDIAVDAKGFFCVDRAFMAGVCITNETCLVLCISSY